MPEEGKSEARGGGRSEHAPSRRTPDSMQRVGARGRAKRGVVGAKVHCVTLHRVTIHRVTPYRVTWGTRRAASWLRERAGVPHKTDTTHRPLRPRRADRYHVAGDQRENPCPPRAAA